MREFLSDEACPFCLDYYERGRILREMVQRLPEGARAPRSTAHCEKQCWDCNLAESLALRNHSVRKACTLDMVRVAVGNDRREQLRLPGAPMGLVLNGMKMNAPGDLEDHWEWLDRVLPVKPNEEEVLRGDSG